MKRIVPLVLLALIVMPDLCRAEDASLQEGIADYRAERFEEAVLSLSEARKQRPTSSLAAFYLGMALKQTGDSPGAIGELRRSLSLEPPVLDAYPELIESLYRAGDYAEARKLIDRAERTGLKTGSIAFLEGLVLAAEGADNEALAAWRTAVERDATLAQASALQTAMVQAKQRNLEGAQQSLRALIAQDPKSDLATLAREYDQTFSRILAGERPWRLAIGLAYLYDDNVIAKPSATIPGVELSGEEDSGMVATVRAEYAPRLGNGWLLNSQYLLNSTTYGSNDTHNTISQSLALVPGMEFGTSALTVPLSATHVMLKQENYLVLGSVRPTLSLMAAPGMLCQLSAGYGRRAMLQDPLIPDEDRDADIFTVSGGYMATFAEGEGVASARYEYSYDDASGSNWDNAGHRGSIGLLLPLAAKVKANLGGDLFWQEYLHIHTLSGVERDDTIYSASAGVTWTATPGFDVTLSYGFTRSDSNIAVYDYRRNTVTAGIEYQF